MAIKQSRSLVGCARKLAEFSSEGFGRRTLVETERFRVVVAALEDGQQIPLHAPPLDLVMTIVEGTGQVMAGDSVHPVRAGDVIVVPAGEMRGLRAIGGRLVAVNVVSPPPGPSDHSHAATVWPPDEEGPDVGALILEEHGALFPHAEHLGSLASESSTLPEPELRSRLAEVLEFLRNGLLPHAHEEERSVYPAVETVLRAVGGATGTMSIDHRFIGEMVEELAGVSDGPLADPEREHARSLLYGLRALLKVHFTKENEAYVPLLNRLSAAERRQLHARLSGRDPGHDHHHHQAEPWPTSSSRVPSAALEVRVEGIVSDDPGPDARVSAIPVHPTLVGSQVSNRLGEIRFAEASAAAADLLDVRALPPAQRHELIFRTLDEMLAGAAITLVNDHDPKPLHYQLEATKQGQFSWEYLERGPDAWRVRIARMG